MMAVSLVGNPKIQNVITIKYGKDHKKLKDGNIPVLGTGGIMRYVESYLYDGESILIGRKLTIDKPQFISEVLDIDTLFYTEIGEKIGLNLHSNSYF
jgi:type I restriction enzyme S subunit